MGCGLDGAACLIIEKLNLLLEVFTGWNEYFHLIAKGKMIALFHQGHPGGTVVTPDNSYKAVTSPVDLTSVVLP